MAGGSVSATTHSKEDRASTRERGPQRESRRSGDCLRKEKPTCELTPTPDKPSGGLLSEFLSRPSLKGQK